jgi:hypothetical protein
MLTVGVVTIVFDICWRPPYGTKFRELWYFTILLRKFPNLVKVWSVSAASWFIASYFSNYSAKSK